MSLHYKCIFQSSLCLCMLTSVFVLLFISMYMSFQTEIELLKAHNYRLLNFPPLHKVS